MEVAESALGSAEDILPKNLHEQNSSQGKLLGFEDGKNVEKGDNQEKMECESPAKPDNLVSSGCDTQVAVKPNDSTVSAEMGKKEHPGSCPKDEVAHCPDPNLVPPQSLDSDTGHTSASFHISLGQLPSPKVARRSLNRYSLKLGTNRRKSLPPLHLDVSDLCKAISLELPETERMAALLLSSFQFSARKLEYSLRQIEGFNPEIFEENVRLLSEELRLHTKKLMLEGTLQKCFEDPRGGLSDPALSGSVAALKENIARFSTESEAWDDLLQTYKKNAEEIAKQLEQRELNQGTEEPFSYLGASQAQVLQAKPDYQKILDSQGEVFCDLERVLDEMQQIVKVCQTYMEDVTQYLRNLSSRLASRTFNNLENSPARKLLKLKTKLATPPPPPEG
uniref:Kinetochore-associated protein DSN1 homolog n=1 Tax=Pogona vitticeps TaxID=103695 RepID=A0A6J0SME0_9SAUR